MTTPSYYKNETGLETSSKQRMILHYLESSKFEIDSYTQHCVATAIKYIDRAGLKSTSNWMDDCWKAADYICQAITGQWLGQRPDMKEEQNGR